MKNARFMTAIKHITNTNILDGLDDQNQKDQSANIAETDDDHFSFSGVAQNVVMPQKNPLSNSVIYDSGCNQPLTYDKARFVGHITPASEWIDTPNGRMLAEGYGTMRVNGKLEDKTIKMDFEKTAWVPTTNMTLVSVNKLKKQGFVWDMNEDVLIQKTKGKKVCDIEEHYGLLIIEFNLVPSINKTVEDVAPVAVIKEDVALINQKEEDSAMKTPHKGSDVASGGGDDVSVPVNFKKENPTGHISVDSMDSVNSNPKWLKDGPDDPKLMDQCMDQ
jgi:hypothetical protein